MQTWKLMVRSGKIYKFNETSWIQVLVIFSKSTNTFFSCYVALVLFTKYFVDISITLWNSYCCANFFVWFILSISYTLFLKSNFRCRWFQMIFSTNIFYLLYWSEESMASFSLCLILDRRNWKFIYMLWEYVA